MVKIFIGNLSGDGEKVTERHIKPLFAKYGTVSRCLVLESRGYGFVHMPNPKEARRAIRDLDGCSVGGCRISVELSNEHGESKTSVRHKTKPCDSVEDCYFFQNETCGRNSQCPFLHRILSGMICKKFLFKKCKRAGKCGKHHVHCSELPPPSEDELARVRRVRKKKSEKDNEEITGASSSQQREKSSPAPDSYFQCLDCRFLATSSYLLETHLNTGEHWERVKQVKLDGEELKGILGDRGDVMCEVCEVRVPERELEEHRQDELHMIMMHRNTNHEDEDWVTVGENVPVNNVERDKPDDIHVCHIPKDMTLSTVRKICFRYGEVIKLKFLPQGNHAYVGYASKDAREFAAIKLKELQRNHFAGASDQLIGLSGSENEGSEKDNVTKICIFRNGHYEDGYLCDECGAVCNSMKQHSRHTSSHDRWKSNNSHPESFSISDPSEYTEVNIARCDSRPELEVDEGDATQLSSVQESQVADAHTEGLLHLRELNNQIEMLTSLRKEEENKLVFCQMKMAICKQTSKSNVETLKLLEEELEIQRNLRDVEENIGKLTIDFNKSMYPSTLQEDGKFHQLSDQFCYVGNSVKSGNHSHPLSKPFFHPDDLFDSDDSLDE